jgi:hypothetical protein
MQLKPQNMYGIILFGLAYKAFIEKFSSSSSSFPHLLPAAIVSKKFKTVVGITLNGDAKILFFGKMLIINIFLS